MRWFGSIPGLRSCDLLFALAGPFEKEVAAVLRRAAGTRLRSCALLLLLCAGFHTALLAQEGSNAGLTGTISDKTGAKVAKAEVVVTNRATHVTYNTTTTSKGAYTIPSIPPGIYDVSATFPGFNKATTQAVTFHVAELVTVNLTLDIASVSDTVTVSGDGELLEKGTAATSRILNDRELSESPALASSNGNRTITEYILTTMPGTNGTSSTGQTGSVNGGQQGSIEVYIDGIPIGATDAAEMAPSIDALNEVNMQVGYMGSQYDGGGTAITNFSPTSGTNAIHGKLLTILQNEDLNANTYVANQAHQGRGQSRYSLYSGSVGGPVFIPKVYNGKNRSFFFFNYERDQIRDLNFYGTTITMPTPGMLQGDFSAFLNPALTQNSQSGTVATTDVLGRPVVFGQIYDPSTQRILSAGQTDPLTGIKAVRAGLVREPFANNAIPSGRIDPVAANYLKLPFPKTYLNNLTTGNVPSDNISPPIYLSHMWSINFDQALTQKQKMNIFLSHIVRNRYLGNIWTLPDVTPISGALDYQQVSDTLVRLNHYWTVSSRVSNHLGVGYMRYLNYLGQPDYNANWAGTLGIPNTSSVGFPTVAFTGQASLAGTIQQLGQPYNGSGHLEDNIMPVDQVYISKGAHQIQVGFEGRLYREYLQQITGPPQFGFSNTATDDGSSSANYAGNAFASFLLGQVTNTTRTIYNSNQNYQRRESGVYVQDDWKVTRNLTINAGIRWHVEGGLYETAGQMAGVDLTLANTGAGNLPGALVFAGHQGRRGFENTSWGMVLPRVGMAYSPTNRVVWRAGIGVNSQAPEYLGEPFWGGTAPSLQGYSGSIAINGTTNPQPETGMAVASLSAAYPQYAGTLPNYDPTQLNLQAATVINPNGAQPVYVVNYNGGMEYALGHKVVAEIGYVGNTSRRLRNASLTQLNQLPLADETIYGDALLDNITLHPTIPLPYVGFKGTVEQALAPHPQYSVGGLTVYGGGGGWSRYDALQAVLTRRSSHGLTVTASYTWAKTLTNTNGSVQDIANKRAEKAVASFLDVPQQLKVLMLYELPLGKGKLLNLHGPLDWIAGGWKVAGNGIYQSGPTLSITDSLVSSGIGSSVRPNYTGLPVELKQHGFVDSIHSTGPLWLNPAAFTHVAYTPIHHTALATGTVPSVLPDVRGPGLAYENLSLSKSWVYKEGREFTLRADAFNAFNRAIMNAPVTDINNPNFGRVISKGTNSSTNYTPRIVQVQAILNF